MKFVSKLTMGLFTALSIIGCSKNDENTPQYSGENRVYITAEGDKTLTIGQGAQRIEAKIALTRNDVATSLRLKAVNAQGVISDLVTFSANPITIANGTREANVTLTLKEGAFVSQEQRLTVTFEPTIGLTAQENLEIVVKPSPTIAGLTDAQRTLLDGYKAKGMDLYPFIGSVKVKTTVHSSANGSTQDFATAFDRTFESQTVIALSEKATGSNPVLKMTDNPMGLEEFLYFLLRKNTIEDTEYFLQQPDPQATMALLGWNKNSQETFKVSLDNLKIEAPQNGTSKIDFIGDVTKDDETVIKAVPFQMTYSAWDRLQKMAQQGNAEASRLLTVDGTSNPLHYVNNDGILEDGYNVGNWKASTGSIDFAKKTMTFEFLVYHSYSSGYVQVKVEYTAQ